MENNNHKKMEFKITGGFKIFLFGVITFVFIKYILIPLGDVLVVFLQRIFG